MPPKVPPTVRSHALLARAGLGESSVAGFDRGHGRHARAGSAMAAAKSRVRPVSINSMALPQTFRHRIRNRHPLRHGEGRLQRQVAQVQEVDALQHRRAAGRKNLRMIV